VFSSLPKTVSAQLIQFAESGALPDVVLRYGIRSIVTSRLADERGRARSPKEFIEELATAPVAIHASEANLQHYEVPSKFFEQVLGERLKYSCAFFADAATPLDHAEEAMLKLTCERAQLIDGAEILELGCGWGSLTLWMAEHYPNSRIVAVSNSTTQREFIERRAREAQLRNVEVITENVATLDLGDARFDRIVSVEMFEHIRNWPALYERIAGWLTPRGLFFKHVFCHDQHPYFFEDDGEADWMARNFFSGGIMPCFALPAHIEKHLVLEDCWKVGGEHYARTAEAWLKNADARKSEILAIFEEQAEFPPKVALQRWRMFFMACAELFGYANGTEWFVGHYLLRAQAPSR
jgi:cyclopropane-fatty-acyl-phospholipid synthase